MKYDWGGYLAQYTLYLNDRGLVTSYSYTQYTEQEGPGNRDMETKGSSAIEYDDTDHIIGIEGNSGVCEYIWDNGNIVEVVRTNKKTNSGAKYYYQYTQEEYIGDIAEYIGNPALGPMNGDCSFLFDYGYFGKRCKNLCTVVDTDATGIPQYSYKYTFNEEGYVTRVVQTYMYYSNPDAKTNPKVIAFEYTNL